MPRYELDAASLNQLLAYFMRQPDDVQRDGALAASMTEQDALVLWLNPSALEVFTATTLPPRAGRVIVSGEMGGLDDAPVAMAWRERVWVLYPYEPAARRNARIAR